MEVTFAASNTYQVLSGIDFLTGTVVAEPSVALDRKKKCTAAFNWMDHLTLCDEKYKLL